MRNQVCAWMLDLKDLPVRDIGAAIPHGAPPRIPWSEPPRAGGSGPRIVHRAVDPVGDTGPSDVMLRRPDGAPRDSNCWALVRRADLVPRWARCYTWGNRPAGGLAAPVLSVGARWAVDLLFTGETVQLDGRTGKVVSRISYPGRAQAVAVEDREHYLVVVTCRTRPDMALTVQLDEASGSTRLHERVTLDASIERSFTAK